MTTKKAKVEKYQKVYLASTILIAIAVVLFLLSSMFSVKVVSNKPANFNFHTDDGRSVKLYLNPNTHKVSYVRVKIFFDKNLVNLSSEPTLNDLRLARIISITPASEANGTGEVEIVVAQNPTDEPISQNFEVATFSFDLLTRMPARLTIVDEDTQVVDAASNLIPFSPTYLELKAN